MLGGIILDRVDSINDSGVIMESKISFTEHIDVAVRRALAMLWFVKRLSCEFRDPYTLNTLYVSLVHPKLERVQMKFVKYVDMLTDMCYLQVF
jgi:hypothetical protein